MGRAAFFLISAERPSSDYKNYQPLIEGSSSVAIFFPAHLCLREKIDMA